VATIGGFAVAKLRLHIARRLWLGLMTELHRRSENRHEAGAFLLGRRTADRREVQSIVYYDDLDPHAYDSGVCILEADSFDLLWDRCDAAGLTVVADVHLHGGVAKQSSSDRDNPMVARAGHLALIVPRFARGPVWRHQLGLYEYKGAHRWTDFSGWRGRLLLKTGTWR
jgi:proteasome lid subunit RPN8/RPN11